MSLLRESKIVVGQKVVMVRKPDFGGVWDVLERIESAKLPLPDLKGSEIGGLLKESADQMKGLGETVNAQPHQIYAAQQAASLRLQAAIADILSANLETIRRWIFGCKPAMVQLIVACSTLEPNEVRGLELVDTLRLLREAWAMTKDSGLIEEMKSFFGGLTAGATKSEPPPSVETKEPETVAAA